MKSNILLTLLKFYGDRPFQACIWLSYEIFGFVVDKKKYKIVNSKIQYNKIRYDGVDVTLIVN